MAEDQSARERATARVRRQPPAFRTVAVKEVEQRSPRLVRVTLAGPELEGFGLEQPAASVRLLLPPPDADELVMPRWNGNEFLLPDGSRPVIRTFTPRRANTDRNELDVEIVVHGGGAASAWVVATGPGDPVAVSGPGRGYAVEGDDGTFLLAGDETAIPAISQLLEVLPPDATAGVHIEVAEPGGRLPLPEHPRAEVHWHDLPPGEPPGATLLTAVAAAEIPDGTRIWVAGEAAGVQRIRRHLFEERGLARRQATVRGYWKHGRAAGGGGDDD